MITTITFNPSIDKRYRLEDLIKGEVTRAIDVQNTAGGKGLNVSRVISLLGEKVNATGFLGGSPGDFIAGKLEEQGIKNSFLRIKGETRSCMAFITKDMCQTEVLEPGPSIQEHEMEEWLKLYHKLLEESSLICASGSLPKGLSSSFYNQIIKIANKKNTRFLLDTSGEALAKSIEAKPYFIKPNIDELKMLSGESINSMSDVEKVIDRLQNYGIEFIIVSLGEKGALAAFKGNKYRINIPKIKAVNPVGSGDSMVAGAAVALSRGCHITETLALAAACGTANAMEEQTGFVNLKSVELLKSQINIEKI